MEVNCFEALFDNVYNLLLVMCIDCDKYKLSVFCLTDFDLIIIIIISIYHTSE